jgi:polyisoprenyl-teichoic acid--peptidoglycan teichoic acid transferase
MRTRILSSILLLFCLLPLPAGAASRPLDRTENILLLGSDLEPGQGSWRTDTIIVMAIDREANRVGLLSIPRDLWVDIPSAGPNRINTVDFLGERRDGPGGGPVLLSQVISQTLGIPTQRYVRIEMSQVAHLIDDLNGITVVLDKPFAEDVPDPALLAQGQRAPLAAGPHHMDGETALAYLRARYVTGDLDRNYRQQQIIWAVAQRVKELGWLSKLPWLWSEFSEMGQTDLSFGDALSLGLFGAQLKPENVHGLTFNYNLARPWTTDAGAQVLLLGERQQVDALVDGLFDARCPGCAQWVPAAPVPSTVGLPNQPPSWGALDASFAAARR